jgi:predicted kinase
VTPRRIVVVSGAPGAGKTTLAVPLAARLGYPLFAKDRIKETLHDALGTPAPDREWSRRMGAAAMELLWALAAATPVAVLEANFRPHSDVERERLAALGGDVVEVHCQCDLGLAARRYNERAPFRHPVHVVETVTPADLAKFAVPFAIGAVVTVDTSVPADIEELAERIAGPGTNGTFG